MLGVGGKMIGLLMAVIGSVFPGFDCSCPGWDMQLYNLDFRLSQFTTGRFYSLGVAAIYPCSICIIVWGYKLRWSFG